MLLDTVYGHLDKAEEVYRETNGITDHELTFAQEDEVWELAANHMGMFLEWVILNGYEDEELTDVYTLQQVRNGYISGVSLLRRDLRGDLYDSCVCKKMRAFVRNYYKKEFLDDYEAVYMYSGSRMYEFRGGVEDYERLEMWIDRAYKRYLDKKKKG